MSDALKTTSYTPVSTQDDPGGSPSRKKQSLSPIFFSTLGLVLRYPFLSSIIIFTIVTGIVAGVVNQSYIQKNQDPYLRIPPNGSGASTITGPSWVLTDDVSQIALVGHCISFDETYRGLVIQWEILGCGTYRTTTYPPATETLEAVGCDSLDRAVDVYLDRWVYIRCRCLRSTC